MDKTKIAVDIFNKYATEYQNKFMNMDLYKESFDLFCENIGNVNAEVLELACGPGNITQYLLSKRPDLNILGTDLSPNMIMLAKANNPLAEFKLMDCRDIGRIGKPFDAIMCGFCFPYLSKEEAIQFIKDASAQLKKEGVLYISTMEEDYSKSGFKTGSQGDEIYMHYHQEDYLVQALKENQFETISLQRQKYKQDGTDVTDLLIVAVK